MDPTRLFRFAGFSAIAGGMLRIVSAFVPWVPASAGLEVFYLCIDVALLAGLFGVYLSLAEELGVLGLIAFGVAAAALASLVGPDPERFGIDFYGFGSSIHAAGLAGLGVVLWRTRAGSRAVAAAWIAVPLLAVGFEAAGYPALGFQLVGIVYGAGFVAAGGGLLKRARSDFDLNQVTLPARDLAESIDFYRRLGLRLIVDSPETAYARFALPGGASTLSLHVDVGVCTPPAPAIYFETREPERVVEELRTAGITPVEALEDKPWLWREAWYADPAGNRLCVYNAGRNRKDPPWRIAIA